jgi:hypothetical protein
VENRRNERLKQALNPRHKSAARRAGRSALDGAVENGYKIKQNKDLFIGISLAETAFERVKYKHSPQSPAPLSPESFCRLWAG